MNRLKGLTWDHPRGLEPLRSSAITWEASMAVGIDWHVRSLKEFGDTNLVELSREFDLLIIDHPHVGLLASQDCLVPFDSTFPTVGLSSESYRWRDAIWALPIDGACQVSARRGDLWKGPLPQTWAEVYKLAMQLPVAMALCPTDTLCAFLTLSAQAGAPFVEGQPFPQHQLVEGVLEQLLQLSSVVTPLSLSWNPIQLYDAMTEEDRLVYCPLAFGYTNYCRPAFRSHTLVFGAIPGRTNALLGGAGIAVTRWSRYKAEGVAYAREIAGSVYQSGEYSAHQGQAGHRDAWTSPLADSLVGGFYSTTFDTLNHAFMRPRHPGWPQFQEELGLIVHEALKNRFLNPRTMCQKLKESYDASYQ